MHTQVAPLYSLKYVSQFKQVDCRGYIHTAAKVAFPELCMFCMYLYKTPVLPPTHTW